MRDWSEWCYSFRHRFWSRLAFGAERFVVWCDRRIRKLETIGGWHAYDEKTDD